MAESLLRTCFDELSERREGEAPSEWVARQTEGLARFRSMIDRRYTEGTLQRLLDNPDPATRRAALLALHQVGTMASNGCVAARLHDDEALVCQMATDALWAIWLRGDTELHNHELQKALQYDEPRRCIVALTSLIRRAPGFAEAYNQRAILHFHLEQYDRSAADCQRVLHLNPYHFGAASGLGRCYLRLRLPGPALKAFRTAHRIHPHLDGLEEAIRDLENVLGEDSLEG